MKFLPRPYREIIGLSAPIAGIQFAQVALTSTDFLMMGWIGVDAVAAGGLAILLYNQFRTMCVGVVTGLGNLIATSVGRGEKRTGQDLRRDLPDELVRQEVRDLVRAALFLATIVAVVAAGLLIAIGYCLTFLGQASAVAARARPVIFVMAPGFLPMLWLNVLRQFAVGMRRAGSLLTVTLCSIVVNAALNAIFIYGCFVIPRLGLAGIGLSTTLVQLWTFFVYLRAVRCDERLGGLLSLVVWRARLTTVLKIVRMGIPIALTYGSEAAITSIATLLMGTFGPIALAASNIVNQLAYIVYQFNIGLSHGASILVSRAIGKEEYGEIGAVARRALTISFLAMTFVGLAYLAVPYVILRPFLGMTGNPAVLATAAILLRFAIAHQLFKGSQNICVGLLRGIGNTRSGLTNTLIGYWCIGIPAMVVCGYPLGWSGNGVWFGLCLGFGATSLLLWRRFVASVKLAFTRGVKSITALN